MPALHRARGRQFRNSELRDAHRQQIAQSLQARARSNPIDRSDSEHLIVAE